MNIEPTPWIPGHSIADLYSTEFHKVAERFDYHPWEDADLKRRAEYLMQKQSPAADRNKLADHLHEYNKEIGNSSLALGHIEKLRKPETLVVVGGQQAGLFTGPLLVIYKALTIIQEAKRAEALLDQDVIPVFWIAGEDHDFQEVNHVYYISSELTYEKIELGHPHDEERAPVSKIEFSFEDWEKVIGQLDASLLPTEFKDDFMGKIRNMAAESRTLSDFFARMMAWLFQAHGLVLIDSHHEDLRDIESPFFETLIRDHQRLNDAFLQGAKKVVELGFEPQAGVQENGVNIFKIHEGQRMLLHFNNGNFTDKKEMLRLSEDELLKIAKEKPQELSNNVLTRPLMQEYLFPVLSTVLGPGEIAYWAMLKEGFKEAGMSVPVIIPRIQITLVEGTLQKHMRKYDLTLEDVSVRFDEKREAWLKEQDELNLDSRFEEMKQQFQERYQPLLDLAVEVNPGMKKLGETNMQKILEQIAFMQKRTTDAYEKQFNASLRQMDRIYHSLMPMGKPQERVYNIFIYANKYGLSWLDELLDTSFSVKTGRYTVYF